MLPSSFCSRYAWAGFCHGSRQPCFLDFPDKPPGRSPQLYNKNPQNILQTGKDNDRTLSLWVVATCTKLHAGRALISLGARVYGESFGAFLVSSLQHTVDRSLMTFWWGSDKPLWWNATQRLPCFGCVAVCLSTCEGSSGSWEGLRAWAEDVREFHMAV